MVAAQTGRNVSCSHTDCWLLSLHSGNRDRISSKMIEGGTKSESGSWNFSSQTNHCIFWLPYNNVCVCVCHTGQSLCGSETCYGCTWHSAATVPRQNEGDDQTWVYLNISSSARAFVQRTVCEVQSAAKKYTVLCYLVYIFSCPFVTIKMCFYLIFLYLPLLRNFCIYFDLNYKNTFHRKKYNFTNLLHP